MTRSAYATAGNEDTEDEHLVVIQVPPAEEQLELAVVRELQ